MSKRILYEIECIKQNNPQYLNDLHYIELICELDNYKKLTFYQQKDLEHKERMFNILLSIKIEIQELRQTIKNK